MVLSGSQSDLSRLRPSSRVSQTLSSTPVQGGVALLEGFQLSVNPSTLLRRVKREEEEERVEQGCEQQEEASGSEIGSLLDHFLEIE